MLNKGNMKLRYKIVKCVPLSEKLYSFKGKYMVKNSKEKYSNYIL